MRNAFLLLTLHTLKVSGHEEFKWQLICSDNAGLLQSQAGASMH